MSELKGLASLERRTLGKGKTTIPLKGGRPIELYGRTTYQLNGRSYSNSVLLKGEGGVSTNLLGRRQIFISLSGEKGDALYNPTLCSNAKLRISNESTLTSYV